MHPILISFPNGFFISTYGVMIAIGLAFALLAATWKGRRIGIPADPFYDLLFLAILSGFLGARVLYILTNIPGFLANPADYIFSRTGFVFLGGLVSASATCIWYVRRRKLDVLKVADIAGPCVAIGHAFGRIGCHLAGCCFGGACALPIAIEVPKVELPGDQGLWSNAYTEHLEKHLIGADAVHSLPIWPVQLMESAGLALLAIGLLALSHYPYRRGFIFGLYLAGYGALRFGLEFLRGDDVRGLYFGGLISTSQIISLVMIVIGAVVIATSRNRDLIVPRPGSEFVEPTDDTPPARSRRPTTGKA